MAIRGDTDYTNVRAAGNLVLDGELSLDVSGALTPGTVFTIMTGKSVEGTFHKVPEGRVALAGGHLFRVSYQNNSVTLTVMRALP